MAPCIPSHDLVWVTCHSLKALDHCHTYAAVGVPHTHHRMRLPHPGILASPQFAGCSEDGVERALIMGTAAAARGGELRFLRGVRLSTQLLPCPGGLISPQTTGWRTLKHSYRDDPSSSVPTKHGTCRITAITHSAHYRPAVTRMEWLHRFCHRRRRAICFRGRGCSPAIAASISWRRRTLMVSFVLAQA